MTQRVVLGSVTKRPIAVVREHGTRVECIALTRWILTLALETIAGYWENQTNKERTPEQMVRDIFSNSPSIR